MIIFHFPCYILLNECLKFNLFMEFKTHYYRPCLLFSRVLQTCKYAFCHTVFHIFPSHKDKVDNFFPFRTLSIHFIANRLPYKTVNYYTIFSKITSKLDHCIKTGKIMKIDNIKTVISATILSNHWISIACRKQYNGCKAVC
ncbi:MAG: hypothetical protein ACJAT7_002196 [Psychromonas sp.]|jgi:hypothetical protein